MTPTTQTLMPLPPLLVEPVVRVALLEDLGRAGDITTMSVVPADARVAGMIAARQAGVIAGLDGALLAFRLVDPAVQITVQTPDGSRIAAGQRVAAVAGPARAILTA